MGSFVCCCTFSFAVGYSITLHKIAFTFTRTEHCKMNAKEKKERRYCEIITSYLLSSDFRLIILFSLVWWIFSLPFRLPNFSISIARLWFCIFVFLHIAFSPFSIPCSFTLVTWIQVPTHSSCLGYSIRCVRIQSMELLKHKKWGHFWETTEIVDNFDIQRSDEE